MKTVTLALVALSLALLACGVVYGPRQEAEAFIAAKDEVIQQWDKTLAANPSEAGVDQARKIFEGKKADLIAKQDAIKAKPKGMNVDWENRVRDSEAREGKVLDAIEVKVAVSGGDAAKDKLKKLREEYEQTVKRWY